MTLTVAITLPLALAMEVAREICFKLAANRSEQRAPNGPYLLRLFGSPLIWLGFACWGTELVAWIMTLAHLPLSIAFPMMSLCYAGMIAAGKYILHEPVAPRQWYGIACITTGVALIGSQGIG